MASTFRCNIVTPTGSVFDDDVSYASIPAWDGQLGVIAGESPVLTRLDAGSLKLETAAGERWYLLVGGFAQIQNDVLTLLTDQAIPAGEIDVTEAEAELAEARARVAGKGEDQARVAADQRRALAKLALARKQ